MTKEERKVLRTTWASMKGRCQPGPSAHKNYYGRGIKVCDEWRDFEVFASDMGPRPEGTSLDRINNNLGYSKENCRWATPKQQMRNTRVNVHMVYKGEKRVIADVAEELASPSIPREIIASRLANRWDPEVAATQPVLKDHKDRKKIKIPHKPSSKGEGPIATEVRTLIKESGKSVRDICVQAGVKYLSLWRWYVGKTKMLDSDTAEDVLELLRKKGGAL